MPGFDGACRVFDQGVKKQVQMPYDKCLGGVGMLQDGGQMLFYACGGLCAVILGMIDGRTVVQSAGTQVLGNA